MVRIALGAVLCGMILVACSGESRRDSAPRTMSTAEPSATGGGFLSRMNPFRNRSDGSRRGRLCGTRGLEGKRLPRITESNPECGIDRPVQVTRVDGVALSQPAILDCETARALRTWVRDGVRPAVGRMGGGVAELQVAAHYVCRTRNHRPGGPVSEHGRGKAIDISAIRMADGTQMTVLNDWNDSPYSNALRQMHNAACGPFGTTLGPGSDGMHEDHFHYDTARHPIGPICR